MELIIWLCECGKAFTVVGDIKVLPGTEWAEVERGIECFKKNHKLTALTVLDDDSFVSNSPTIEAVKTTYFYARDKEGKKYVIKRWREASGDNFHYEGFWGEIKTEVAFLAVQKDAITKQLQAEAVKEGFVASNDHIDLIVAHLNNQISCDRYNNWLRPNNIIISHEHPLMIIVPLPPLIVESLYRLCRRFFPEKQKIFIGGFIWREKGPNGVLAFVGRRKFEIIYY